MLLMSTLARNYKRPHKSFCVHFMVLKISLNDSLCSIESIYLHFKLWNSPAQELWARLQQHACVMDTRLNYLLKQTQTGRVASVMGLYYCVNGWACSTEWIDIVLYVLIMLIHKCGSVSLRVLRCRVCHRQNAHSKLATC